MKAVFERTNYEICTGPLHNRFNFVHFIQRLKVCEQGQNIIFVFIVVVLSPKNVCFFTYIHY